MRRAALVLLLCILGCGDSSPLPDSAMIRIRTEAREVELGRAFPLSVVRVFAKDGDAPEFRDADLAPLTVNLLGTTRRENDRFVEETRSYHAWAFTLDDVTVPALSDQDVPLSIRVRPALDPEDPGPAERPEGPLHRPFPWLLLAAMATAIAGVTGALIVRRRRPARETRKEPAPPVRTAGPRERALVALRKLRGVEPGGHNEQQAFHIELSGIIRRFLNEHLAVGAAEMTTAEVITAVAEAERAGLREVLTPCDFVKFARHHPDGADREATLDAAMTFVEGAS